MIFALFSYFYVDKNLALYFHENIVGTHLYIWEYITEIGDAKYSIALGVVLLLFFKLNKKIFYFGAILSSSVALSGLSTDLIKFVVGRSRPNMLINENIYTFKPLQQYSYDFISMPSGHTTTVFSMAAVFSIFYPRFSYLFFFIAVVGGMSRVVLQKHFLSDVVIGAIVGTVVTVYLHKKFFEKRLEI